MCRSTPGRPTSSAATRWRSPPTSSRPRRKDAARLPGGRPGHADPRPRPVRRSRITSTRVVRHWAVVASSAVFPAGRRRPGAVAAGGGVGLGGALGRPGRRPRRWPSPASVASVVASPASAAAWAASAAAWPASAALAASPGAAGLGGLGGGIGGIAGHAVGLAGIGGQLGGLGGIQGGIGGLASRCRRAGGGSALGSVGGLNQSGGFGLQNNTLQQAKSLQTLITQVVGNRRDWAPRYNEYTGLPINPLDTQEGVDPLQGENNNLGYYEPALALVVKGTSRITSRASSPVTISQAPATMGMLPGPGGDRVAQNGKPLQVGGAGDKQNLDPQVRWQDALAQGTLNPGLSSPSPTTLPSTGASTMPPSSSRPTSARGSSSGPGSTRRWPSLCTRAAAAAEELRTGRGGGRRPRTGRRSQLPASRRGHEGPQQLQPGGGLRSPGILAGAQRSIRLRQRPGVRRTGPGPQGHGVGRRQPPRQGLAGPRRRAELKARATQKLKTLTAALARTDKGAGRQTPGRGRRPGSKPRPGSCGCPGRIRPTWISRSRSPAAAPARR